MAEPHLTVSDLFQRVHLALRQHQERTAIDLRQFDPRVVINNRDYAELRIEAENLLNSYEVLASWATLRVLGIQVVPDPMLAQGEVRLRTEISA